MVKLGWAWLGPQAPVLPASVPKHCQWRQGMGSESPEAHTVLVQVPVARRALVALAVRQGLPSLKLGLRLESVW